MSVIWSLFTTFSLLGSIVSPQHSPDDHHGVTCYHCNKHADRYPDCLTKLHSCHPDELCYMSNKQGDFEIRCRPKPECDHMRKDCHHEDCEVCCHDDNCVSQQLVTLFRNGTTEQVTTAIQSDDLQTETCEDNLFDGACQTFYPAVCRDKAGIAVCSQTCGLCPLMQNAFHGSTCTDRVSLNNCESLNTTDAICSSPVAALACPKTCNLCDILLQNLITELISSYQVSTPAPTGTTNSTLQCYACNYTSCSDMNLVSCPVGQDYCMNTISQSSTGQRNFTRGCVEESACRDDWWLQTASHADCFLLDNSPEGPAGTPLPKCSFCCQGDGCNKDAVPLPNFLYNPNKVSSLPNGHFSDI